ncbi:MAG: hypothetical protein JKY44_10865 [Flavobacteriaceae bacterium]|nr:hypothetical protein [Flavobacteriaceae bacterium]
MNQRRLGNEALANQLLEPIKEKADIIENMSYYELCKFYKKMIPLEAILSPNGDSPSLDAVKYGVASWYFYTNKKEQAKTILEEIVNSNSWNSSGYIAAESDLMHYYGYSSSK